MLIHHIRAWFLGRPKPPVQPAKPRDPLDAQRAAAPGGPKPVIEAVGEALAAVGELVVSIRASTKAAQAANKKKHRASPRKRAARAPRARRGVVVVEAIRVEPRPPSAPSSRSASRTTRTRTRVVLREDPIIVAPARAASSRAEDFSEGT